MEQSFISIKNIAKHFGKNKALDGVTLTINTGEIMSLLGVNGAGKTTLSSIIATLHPPTSGDITCKGISIYKNIPAFRRIIGLCPQRTNLKNMLTVRENLEASGRYYGLSKQQVEEQITELSKNLQLTKHLDDLPTILSGGYKQRVLIARSLMHSPKLLILDEPTVALDPQIRHQLWNYIKTLKKQGIAILLTTHYLDEAEVLSDRVCVLDKGKVRLIDTPQNLKSSFKKSRLEDVFIQLTTETQE
jgi:ABC-2 type transport system ATP-binding protein